MTAHGEDAAGQSVEDRTSQIAAQLNDRFRKHTNSVFAEDWWTDQILRWAEDDPSVRHQLLRLADALPSLRTHRSLCRHLTECFQEATGLFQPAMPIGTMDAEKNELLSKALSVNTRRNAARVAERLLGDNDAGRLADLVDDLSASEHSVVIWPMFPEACGRASVLHYSTACINAIRAVAPSTTPEDIRTPDFDEVARMPPLEADSDEMRMDEPLRLVRIEVNRLDDWFPSADIDGRQRRILDALRQIIPSAAVAGVGILLTASPRASDSVPFECLTELVSRHPRLVADMPIGLSLNARDLRTLGRLKFLADLASSAGIRISVQIDSALAPDMLAIQSRQRGGVSAMAQSSISAGTAWRQIVDFLLSPANRSLSGALVIEQISLLASAIAVFQERSSESHRIEIRLPLSAPRAMLQVIKETGLPTGVVVPSAAMLDGLALLARVHLENPSLSSTIGTAITTGDRSDTIRNHPESPHSVDDPTEQEPRTRLTISEFASADNASHPFLFAVQSNNFVTPKSFVNESLTDFSDRTAHDAMRDALTRVREDFGAEYPLIFDGKASDSRASIISRSPSRRSDVVGRVASASAEQAADAVNAARRAFSAWAAVPGATRAEYLELVAAELSIRRCEFAAWVILECGMTWPDADAEVAMAIDLIRYYATGIRELTGNPGEALPGERTVRLYRALGVCSLLTPSSAPLSAPAGMISAAIAAGNTCVLKPSEKTPIIAANFVELFRNVELPDGVVNFVPGHADQIGNVLVTSPDVDVVVFSGTADVGVEIHREASETDPRQKNVRKVISEFCGSNAIVIDETADLADAAAIVAHDAFSFAGQHSNRCARVIVLNSVADEFRTLLVQAVESMTVGDAEDPATNIGPAIDEQAAESTRALVASLEEEFVLPMAAAELPDQEGNWVRPAILNDLPSDSDIATEIIHGPVLRLFQVRNLDDAFSIANSGPVALGSALFSRSPKSLRRAITEFHAGSVFLNRGFLPVRVSRHPFAGYRLSGSGSRLGSAEYLSQFLAPIAVTENSQRLGIDAAIPENGLPEIVPSDFVMPKPKQQPTQKITPTEKLASRGGKAATEKTAATAKTSRKSKAASAGKTVKKKTPKKKATKATKRKSGK